MDLMEDDDLGIVMGGNRSRISIVLDDDDNEQTESNISRVINYDLPRLDDYSGINRQSTHENPDPALHEGGEVYCSDVFDQNNILWRARDETDPLEKLIPEDSEMKRSCDVLYSRVKEFLFEQYGFCCCTSRNVLDGYLKKFLESYKPLDLNFLQNSKYRKPLWSDASSIDCNLTVGDFTILLLNIFSQSGKLSGNDCSKFLKLFKLILEGNGYKTNFCVTFSRLTNGLDLEMEKRSFKLVICIHCKSLIHLFWNHFEDNQVNAATPYPICNHCFPIEEHGNMSPLLRKQISPFLKRNGKFVAKPRHYIIFNPFCFFFNDLFVYDSSLRSKLLAESVLRKKLIPDFMENCVRSKLLQFRNEDRYESEQYLCVFEINQDDVASRNHSSTSVKVGLQCIDFPVLSDRTKFDKIFSSIIQEGHGKSQELWVSKILNMYLVTFTSKFAFETGFLLPARTAPGDLQISEELEWNGLEETWFLNLPSVDENETQFLNLRYVCSQTKMDKVDYSDSLGIKRNFCDSCRRISDAILQWNHGSGVKRNIFTVLAGNGFSNENEYKRGIKKLCPLVELFEIYDYRYFEQNAMDIMHKVINSIDNVQNEIPADLFKAVQQQIYEFLGSFKGMKRFSTSFSKIKNWRYEEKKNFLGIIAPSLCLFANEENKILIKILLILSECVKMLFSDIFDYNKWDKLHKMFIREYRKLKPESGIPHCYHKIFSHILKGVQYRRFGNVDDGKIQFRDTLINILENNSTKLAETYYVLTRRNIERGSNFANYLNKKLMYKNLVSMIVDFKKISEPDDICSRILEKMNYSVKDKVLTSLAGEYEGYSVSNYNKDFFLEELVFSNNVQVISILQYLLGLTSLDNEKKMSIEECLDCLNSSAGINEKKQSVADLQISIGEYGELKPTEYPFEFTSINFERSNTTSTKDMCYNSNVLFKYSYVSEESDGEMDDESDEENSGTTEFFKFVGKILHIYRVSIAGILCYIVVIQHHRRLGFWVTEHLDEEICKIVGDLEIVQQDGKGIKTVDVSSIIRHVILLKFTPLQRSTYSLYETSLSASTSRRRRIYSTSENFSIVLQLPHSNSKRGY